jgi:hypothetical protein
LLPPVVLVCALVAPASTAFAAVSVDCANPQPPRVPFAVKPLAAAAATGGQTLPYGAAIPDQVVVRFAPTASGTEQAQTLAPISPDVVEQSRGTAADVVEFGAGVTTDHAAEVLRRRASVEFAEPDYALGTTLMPNDPDLGSSWPLRTDSRAGAPRRPGDLRAEDAWALSTGAGVRVAVIDTGVDPSSRDLAGGVLRNPDDPPNGVDDDNNGLVDDYRGWDFVADRPNLSDDGGHGTHVAGIIGARADNGVEVAGLASGAELIPVRALGEQFGSTSDVVAGLTYAINEYGTRIVNLSLAGSSYSQLMAIAFCSNPNVLFVAAAGNDGRDVDAQPTYPCAYDLPNVLCVGATDERDHLASFSNHGPGTVQIAAPGVSIVSTGFGASIQTYSGTSQATPMVSAAAALVLQRAPGLTAAEIKAVLLNTADRIPALTSSVQEGRRLNAGRAVASLSRPWVRDPRVEVRNGKLTILGTLVTAGPTTLYVLHGKAGAVNAKTDERTVDDASNLSIVVAGAGASDRYRLVADNARGLFESFEFGLVEKPAITLAARRQGNAVIVNAKVNGWSRAQIASIELLLGRNGQRPRRTSAPITVDTPVTQHHVVYAQLNARRGSRYRVVLRVTTYAGAVAEKTIRVPR